MRSFVLFCLALSLAGCGPSISPIEALLTREVTLPGGHIIKAETAVDTRDTLRGLMFRASLAPDHGMLFVHPVVGHYSYWMYQTYIPLDMIWMDEDHKIVELVESAPPCKTVASKCAHFGGHENAKFVLELNGGAIRKYGLKAGETIQW
jgi:uncharacterized membrane protein (UPF0127 family)